MVSVEAFVKPLFDGLRCGGKEKMLEKASAGLDRPP